MLIYPGWSTKNIIKYSYYQCNVFPLLIKPKSWQSIIFGRQQTIWKKLYFNFHIFFKLLLYSLKICLNIYIWMQALSEFQLSNSDFCALHFNYLQVHPVYLVVGPACLLGPGTCCVMICGDLPAWKIFGRDDVQLDPVSSRKSDTLQTWTHHAFLKMKNVLRGHGA